MAGGIEFPQLIKLFRGDRSLREFSKDCKIDASTLCRLEQGKDFSVDTLRKLFKYLPLNKKDILLSLDLL